MLLKKISNLGAKFTKQLSSFKQHFQLPEKWKGGRLEKWNLFWQGLYLDYKSVALDAIQESSRKPRKAFTITSGLGLLFAAIKMNPDEQSFHDRQLQCITDLSMVGELIRNPTAEDHLTYLTRCQNQGTLQKIDLLFFSLIWEADYSKECNIYPAQCKYLQPQYFTFYQRIVDVGLFGLWINLMLKMRDFDVNPNEWKDQT